MVGVILMKTLTKEMLRGMIVGFLLPALLMLAVVGISAASGEENPPQSGVPVTLPAATSKPQPVTQSYILPVLMGDLLKKMDLEEYLVGVLLAEVPAAFEMEALKAQAVAARTFALKYHILGYKHDGAVCTNAACCQGYLTPEQYLEEGGRLSEIEKMQDAVSATAGQVLVYQGELILATYFDCSGGSTEDASAVWGQVYPYLQAVESPGEETATHYSDEKQFTSQQFQDALGVHLSGAPTAWFGEVTFTPGGGVDTMKIGTTVYRGTTLRSLLGLRSTVFTVTVKEDEILITTKGYGHRVGMSQYGAEAMAVSGNDYSQILLHYYQGAEIVQHELNCGA